MAKIYERLHTLRQEETDNLRTFVAQHGGHTEMTPSHTTDDGEEEYDYTDQPMAIAWVARQNHCDGYCEIAVHAIDTDERGRLWFTYSPYEEGTFTYTDWDTESLYDLEFITGQLEYIQECIEQKYR